MATVKLFAPTDMANQSTWYGDVVQATASRIVVTDGYRTAVYLGQNFQYNAYGITGGTLTGFEAYAGGAPIAKISGLSVAATTAAALINSNNVSNLFALALRGADQMTGSAGNDVILGFAGDDTLKGAGGHDGLNGGSGNDTIFGGGGNDTIFGSAGRDRLSGDAGNDIFDFDRIADSASGASTRDAITDFNFGNDRIDLSSIDAIPGGSNSAFSFIGTAAFSGLGQVRVAQSGSNALVQVNTVSGGGPEMTIVLIDTLATSINAGDFIL
jgi:Ca2+-binding RTX toxin-like protein